MQGKRVCRLWLGGVRNRRRVHERNGPIVESRKQLDTRFVKAMVRGGLLLPGDANPGLPAGTQLGEHAFGLRSQNAASANMRTILRKLDRRNDLFGYLFAVRPQQTQQHSM